VILRKVLLLVSMVIGALALSPPGSAGAASEEQRPIPILGIAKSTTTVNLNTGAGTTVNYGYLLGIGLFFGVSSSTFAHTGATTFSGTGSGTLVTASGELFYTSSAFGTLGQSSVTSRTVDTITGGTRRFAGDTGQVSITAGGTSVSTVGSTETFTTFGFWVGSVSVHPVGLADLGGSLTGTVSNNSGCGFVGLTLDATYPGSSAVGTVTLQMTGCVPSPTNLPTFSYAGTFTLTTSVGTLSGTVSGQIVNDFVGPEDLEPTSAALTLTATSGTGDFTGTTGTLNVNLEWATPGASTYTGTVAPA
jgi:hypothetical protein